MGSDLFINHALTGMQRSYNFFGIRFTNFFINNTVSELFCAGETVESLAHEIEVQREKNINIIGNYVVEGLDEMDEAQIQEVTDVFLQSVEA